MRVGLFTYSTKPRGGVVHTLELAHALHRLGHQVTVTALDESGSGMFRPVPFACRIIPVQQHRGTTLEFVRSRVATYVSALCGSDERVDVYHAHDGISANALATLREENVIPEFVRTVHHLDAFDDPELNGLQDRAVTSARACFVVSDLWRRELLTRFGIAATVVPSGADTVRFRPAAPSEHAALRERFGSTRGPLFLAIGGIEERKNTLGILAGFARVRLECPNARLLVAGGSSVFDHSRYRAQFDAQARSAGLQPDIDIAVLGPVDDATVVELLQAADALVFPSLREGFGLVVLEALACGTPPIVSAIEPFTSYLEPDDALFCDPLDAATIAESMLAALRPGVRAQFRVHGPAVAQRYDWQSSARAHIAIYEAEEKANAGDSIRRAVAG
ncbi:MAG: MSMEG_0565 family glycosyltransferase [Candidatus Velthaea sp.]